MWRKARWLARFWKDFPHVLAILLLLTPVQAAIQSLVPRLFGFVIDYLRTGEAGAHEAARLIARTGEGFGLSPGPSFAVLFALLGVLSGAVYALVQSSRAWMNCRLEWAFRQDAFDRITTKGPDFFNRFRTGDLVTRLTDDVAEKLSWFSCSGVFRLYEALMHIIVITVMMISIDPRLTLWTAGPLPLVILIFFRSSSALDKRYDALQSRISKVNDVAEACFSGIRIVKSYVREAAQSRKFDDASRERQKAEIDSVKAGAIIDSMYNYIWQFGVVVVLVVGGMKVLAAELTVGEMASFIYYVVWLVFPMFDVGQFLVKSRQSAVSIGRLIELEEVAPMVADGDASQRLPAPVASGRATQSAAISGSGGAAAHSGGAAAGSDGAAETVLPAVASRREEADAPLALRESIRLERVGFGFEGARAILRGVDVTIRRGETVALVGRVGSGKTWISQMLPRLVDPTEGRITLDGRDIREIPVAALRGMIGFVPQEPVLFSDTVRNNILFGREGIDPETLQWALEVSQLAEEVARFPKALDTPIGTRGMSISGGQKQRLALARALAGRPQVLVLDDCTSALDSRTETALWARLHEVMPEMTSVLVTHRPDTLSRTDRIYVLKDGEVVEAGRHRELMELEGEYARIYRRYELAEAIA